MDLRQNLPPLLPAALLPPVPAAQVEEVLAGHDQHLLRRLRLFRLVVPLEAAGEVDLGAEEKARRLVGQRRAGGTLKRGAATLVLTTIGTTSSDA